MGSLSKFDRLLPGRGRKVLVAVAVLALIALPVSNVLASHVFSDVPTSAFYHNSVTAIANAGITGGCGGTKYCPNSAVTRGQMAVFIDRLGNLRNEHGPVTDALSVFGQATVFDSETFTVTGTPTATECLTSTNPVPMFSVLPYLLTAHLTNAPVTTSTVNVSIDDPDPEDEEFDVCFTNIAGTPLTLGDYDTTLSLSLTIGSGAFAKAGTSDGIAAATRFIQSWK